MNEIFITNEFLVKIEMSRMIIDGECITFSNGEELNNMCYDDLNEMIFNKM